MYSHRYIRCFAVVLLVSLSVTAVAETVSPFPDMIMSWIGYQDAVTYLKHKGSINGYPDGKFHPRETVNRAEFLKLVFRSRGAVEPATGECFADVQADAWYAPYVCAAKRRDIVSGYAVGSRTFFKPDQPINFAEAIKMAMLTYGNDVTTSSGGHDWYKPYVAELDRLNILPSSSYIPWDPITRERAADLIARFVRSTEDRVVPNLSAGCGKSEKEASTTIAVNGVQRSYLLTKPNNYVSHDPSPLIIAFHGRTNSNEQVRAYFGLDRSAKNYFIAYPAAISNGNGTFSWSDPGDKASELRDFRFFDAVVKEVSENYCIDMDHIFVVGHSLGAWFANSVACARGGVVRGSATVGGSTTMKNCTGPTAALIINNPKDASSPHSAAETMRDIRLSANACESTLIPLQPNALSCVQYGGCSENPVLFCPHTIDKERNGTYYPHLWPSGTADAIVRFFEGL